MFNEYKNMEFWKPLITVMEDIFLKYYEDMPVIFACAAALDPIIKVEGVEVILEEIESHLGTKNSKSVESFSRNFHELYNFYDLIYGVKTRNNLTLTSSSKTNLLMQSLSRKKSRTSSSLNELDLYCQFNHSSLMNHEEIQNLDILTWCNGP